MEPANSAARNQMTPQERQCYDWGYEDAVEQERKRIIALLLDYGMFIHTKRAEILIEGGTRWQPITNT